MNVRRAVAFSLLSLASASGSLLGQQPLLEPGSTPTVPPGAPTYGTTSIVSTTHALDFNLVGGTEGAINGTIIMRSCASGPCSLTTTLNLPSGALIQAIEFSGCDSDATTQSSFSILRQTKPDGLPAFMFTPPGTGVAAVPGCGTFPFSLPTPHTVDNNANNYLLHVFVGSGANVLFGAYRVIYRLQVSPAPGVATFADVPTGHPFFRWIEALASAGITGGCTPAPNPNYCPNAPITRGEMAVFLSVALGLNFPN